MKNVMTSTRAVLMMGRILSVELLLMGIRDTLTNDGVDDAAEVARGMLRDIATLRGHVWAAVDKETQE